MAITKVKPKLQVNTDDIQLIKASVRKKHLSPADILMSNLTVTNFTVNALINKMETNKTTTLHIGNRYLYLLPQETSVDMVTDLEKQVLNDIHVHKTCFTPRIHKANNAICYNQENNNFEYGSCNSQDKMIKSTVVEINDLVNEFVKAYLKNSVSCIIVKDNKNYRPLHYLLICQNKGQIDKIKQSLD